MMKTEISLPILGLAVGTRGMLGAGIGLLAAGRLTDEQRKAVGWTLFAVGAVTTVPLLMLVFGHRRGMRACSPENRQSEG